MNDNICIHHTDAERNAWRIGCPICLSNQLAAVTAELDVLKQSILDLSHPNCQMLLQDKDACQQEARRLREALDGIKAAARVAFIATTDPMMTDTLAGIGKRCHDALASTPAPVHSDTEKDIRALSNLLQDCLAHFQSIATDDDSGAFEINHHLRTQLDALCKQIKAEI